MGYFIDVISKANYNELVDNFNNQINLESSISVFKSSKLYEKLYNVSNYMKQLYELGNPVFVLSEFNVAYNTTNCRKLELHDISNVLDNLREHMRKYNNFEYLTMPELLNEGYYLSDGLSLEESTTLMNILSTSIEVGNSKLYDIVLDTFNALKYLIACVDWDNEYVILTKTE